MIHRHDLIATLAEAVGDDPALAAELHAGFLESAHLQLARMAAGHWTDGAARLAGLAASFGATALLALAQGAEAEPSSDIRLRQLRAELARLHG